MTIIAVDNDREALAQTERALKSVYLDCAVRAYTDPLFALQYCANHAGEIERVFTAVLLRPIDGFALGETLKRIAPGTAVEYVTQTDSAELFALIQSRGGWYRLVKPVTAETLGAQAPTHRPARACRLA